MFVITRLSLSTGRVGYTFEWMNEWTNEQMESVNKKEDPHISLITLDSVLLLFICMHRCIVMVSHSGSSSDLGSEKFMNYGYYT